MPTPRRTAESLPPFLSELAELTPLSTRIELDEPSGHRREYLPIAVSTFLVAAMESPALRGVDYLELDPVTYGPALCVVGVMACRARLDTIRATVAPEPEGEDWSVPDRHDEARHYVIPGRLLARLRGLQLSYLGHDNRDVAGSRTPRDRSALANYSRWQRLDTLALVAKPSAATSSSRSPPMSPATATTPSKSQRPDAWRCVDRARR